jgi:hypothetical protein
MNLNYSCQTCRFWAQSPSPENPLEGECRRKAPVAIISPEGEVGAVFPVTAYNDFCGEQEFDELKAVRDTMSDEELKVFIEESLETSVVSFELERDQQCEYVMGRIMIDKEPEQEDAEAIADFLGETYNVVDISLHRG